MLEITFILFLYAICTDRHTIENLINKTGTCSLGILAVLSRMLKDNWIDEHIVNVNRPKHKSVARSLATLNTFALRLISKRERRQDSTSVCDSFFILYYFSITSMTELVTQCTSREIISRTLLAIFSQLPNSFRDLSSPESVQSILQSVKHGIGVLGTSLSEPYNATQINLHLRLLDLVTASYISSTAEEDNPTPLFAELENVNLAVELCNFISAGASRFCHSQGIPVDEGEHRLKSCTLKPAYSNILHSPTVSENVAISLKILVSVVDSSKTWSDTLTAEDSPLMLSLIQCIRVAYDVHSKVDIESTGPGTSSDVLSTDILLLSMGLLQTILESSLKARVLYRQLCKPRSCYLPCVN